MGFNYEDAASEWRRGRPLSTEAPYRFRLSPKMKRPSNWGIKLSHLRHRRASNFSRASRFALSWVPVIPTCLYLCNVYETCGEHARYGLSCYLSVRWYVDTVEMWRHRPEPESFAFCKRRTGLHCLRTLPPLGRLSPFSSGK